MGAAAYKFSPTAYAKVVWLLRNVKDETAAMGIVDPNNKWRIIDIEIVEQESSACEVELLNLPDFALEMEQRGYDMEQCMRVWIHTHPGASCTPSNTDETTFDNLLSAYPYFGMIIFGRELDAYAKVGYRVGPPCNVEVKVKVDWDTNFVNVDFDQFKKDVEAKVKKKSYDYKKWWSKDDEDSYYPWKKGNAPSPHFQPSPSNKFRENYDQIDWSPAQKKMSKKEKRRLWKSLSSVTDIDNNKVEYLCKDSGISPVQLHEYMRVNKLTADEVEKLWDCVVEDIKKDFTY